MVLGSHVSYSRGEKGVTNTVGGSSRKRTDLFPVDLAVWSATMSLIRTVLETWREQKSVWIGSEREWGVRN